MEQRKLKQFDTEERLRDLIYDQFGTDDQFPPLADLSLCDAVYLMACIRHSLSEDMGYVAPFSGSLPLAPGFGFTKKVVDHLYRKRLIRVSPDSDINAFVFDLSSDRISAYYPDKVIWELLPGSTSPQETKDYLEALEQRIQSAWSKSWAEDRTNIWMEIAKHECIEYYLYLLEQREYKPEKIGEKTNAVFENLLKTFSVAQIMNLSWQAVRDTTDYNVREQIPNWRGTNNFIGAVQRKAERAIAQKWEVKQSRRDYDCPQSIVSSTYFNLFLEIGDAAFEMRIPQRVDAGEE